MIKLPNFNKPSVSGLMSQAHEISRFENLFFKSIDTAYYNKLWGLDWIFWIDSSYELPVNSFISYLTQEATKRGIVIDDITYTLQNFTLTINVKIEGLDYEVTRGFEL